VPDWLEKDSLVKTEAFVVKGENCLVVKARGDFLRSYPLSWAAQGVRAALIAPFLSQGTYVRESERDREGKEKRNLIYITVEDCFFLFFFH